MNWGCGGDLREDWVNVDRQDYGDRAVRHDITTSPLPFADETFDYIVANHSLQALAYADVVPALAELRRVLDEGGVLRVIVPDLFAGLRALDSGDHEWFPNREQADEDEAFTYWLTWGGSNLTVFTVHSLWSMTLRAGFREPTIAAPGQSQYGLDGITDLDSRAHESLFMEATR